MLGQFDMEGYLRKNQPDVGGNILKDLSVSENISAPEVGRPLPDTRPALYISFFFMLLLKRLTLPKLKQALVFTCLQ